MEKSLPALLQIPRNADAAKFAVKSLPRDFVGARGGQAPDAGEDFQIGDAIKERPDQWLDGHQRAIGRPSVSPGLKEMRHRQMPIAFYGCLIFVVAEPNDLFCFSLSIGPVDIRRGVVAGVASDDDQCIDLIGIE